MVKYGDSGRVYRNQPTPPLASSNRSMPFWFYFYPRHPSLLLRLFLSIKRKSRTSCQPIALALGHSVLVDRKNFWEDRRDCRRWSWKLRRGEGRLKGFSCVGIFVMRWLSTKNLRSLLNFSGVGAGEEQEKYSRCYSKKVDWAAKSGYLTAGKNFRWVVVQSGTSEKKTNQK